MKKRQYYGREQHPFNNTRLHNIWTHMKSRCYNKNRPQYKDWGGRGIIVCDEWKYSFLSFRNWALKNGYRDDLSIDRINNDGNYEPSNCRFANKNTQARNTKKLRRDNTSGYRGVTITNDKTPYMSRIIINGKQKYLGRYNNIKEAAKAYDSYIIINNLEHTKNDVPLYSRI